MIRGVFVFLLPAIAAYGQPLPLEGIAHVGFRVTDGVVFTSSGFVYVSAENRGSIAPQTQYRVERGSLFDTPAVK